MDRRALHRRRREDSQPSIRGIRSLSRIEAPQEPARATIEAVGAPVPRCHDHSVADHGRGRGDSRTGFEFPSHRQPGDAFGRDVPLRGIVSPLLGTEAVRSPVVRRALAAAPHTVRQEGGRQRGGRRGEEAPSRDLRRGARPRAATGRAPDRPEFGARAARHASRLVRPLALGQSRGAAPPTLGSSSPSRARNLARL